MEAVTVDYSKYRGLLFARPQPGILLITINRPEKLNAADEELHDALGHVWLDVARDDETRVAVITGAGRAFSAGGDIEMQRRALGNYRGVVHTMQGASDLVYNMISCDKPIISAINGVAVGAGLAVALLADISIIAEEVRLTDGHVRIGIAAGDHSVMLWPLLCGMARAKYYLLTADFLDGREAERIGLVSKAVPADRLMDEAMAVAARLANGSQDAIRWTKKALNNWLRQAGPLFDASLALEMLGLFNADVVEGLDAVVEKRAPVFPSVAGPQEMGGGESPV
jgi:enoyl-CoA hydratase